MSTWPPNVLSPCSHCPCHCGPARASNARSADYTNSSGKVCNKIVTIAYWLNHAFKKSPIPRPLFPITKHSSPSSAEKCPPTPPKSPPGKLSSPSPPTNSKRLAWSPPEPDDISCGGANVSDRARLESEAISHKSKMALQS